MTSFKFLSCVKCLAVVAGVVAVTGVGFLYSGLYPMGADDHHNDLTYWTLETLRERSIARASNDIEVPADLNSSERLLAGGADYNDMCTGCHLKPGKTQSDFTLGLYPAPPNLTQAAHLHDDAKDAEPQARRRFWIIKHGIKASGMPAWGPGHDDERIWNMVAFLQRLPELSPQQYQILTARDADDAGHH
ncbi:MAG: cytochrome c [Pseudomonadota bacterium]|jgi:mono/diheme cytochrome c family protein|uniref:c-type cytochrome n=1 Tax=Gallaecimonas pentaromativorans TaxID=584787 RepID=UPI00067EF2A7|nr:cytochrome c [Gallaecimonas pentaromativorans]MED5523720.1 cytochrome c [Pseudomonadota bacterium]TNE81015.1 MAG: cytochrome c [Gammaproteobacteria bacterium]TNF00514.1 MAG: cytochrome c [Gammaproteobacteria bacterium]